MTNQRAKKGASKELCQIIKEHLLMHYPHIRKLKVKPYYDHGFVSARCKLGVRNIYVRGKYLNVIDNFSIMYYERLPTAF